MLHLRILKLALWDEVIRDVGGDQVHVLHVVIDQVDAVVGERLHHWPELLLCWHSNCGDLGRSQSWLLCLSTVGLIGHHTKGNRKEEIAAALEGSGVTLEHIETFTISLSMGLEL